MGRKVECSYQLEYKRLTDAEVARAASGDMAGFKYFFENCCQVQDRDTRQLIHPTMNRGQEMIASTIFKHINLETRANEHKEVVICGPRQFGKSTILMSIGDYLASYVKGMERSNIVHTLQTGGAANKFVTQKVTPLISGVHPDIYPTIIRETDGSSTQFIFKDLLGQIRRDSIYEVLSAGSNSVRSGTVTVWLCDEPSEYRNPEVTEDAISGAISSYGFSFTAYIGTFSDRLSQYFLTKILQAIENPDEMELVFIPWFLVYGREEDGLDITLDDLTDYDRDVIIPEMEKYGFSEKEMLNKIGWYHKRALRTSKMRYEFPTCVDDIIKLTTDQCVFAKEDLDKQDKNILAGTPYRFVTDNRTGKVEAQKTDISPFSMFKQPLYGRRYRVSIDPITARSEESDYFEMHVWDTTNNEQVAVFRDKNLSDQEYADYAVSIATIYNKAQLCPESNVSMGFVVAVNERRYYNWYYSKPKEKNKRLQEREIGIRTTVSTKEGMIDNLNTLLNRDNIIIHDEMTLNELRDFIKKINTRSDGTRSVRMAARGKGHDDAVACCWIYAGSLSLKELSRKKSSGVNFVW